MGLIRNFFKLDLACFLLACYSHHDSQVHACPSLSTRVGTHPLQSWVALSQGDLWPEGLQAETFQITPNLGSGYLPSVPHTIQQTQLAHLPAPTTGGSEPRRLEAFFTPDPAEGTGSESMPSFLSNGESKRQRMTPNIDAYRGSDKISSNGDHSIILPDPGFGAARSIGEAVDLHLPDMYTPTTATFSPHTSLPILPSYDWSGDLLEEINFERQPFGSTTKQMPLLSNDEWDEFLRLMSSSSGLAESSQPGMGNPLDWFAQETTEKPWHSSSHPLDSALGSAGDTSLPQKHEGAPRAHSTTLSAPEQLHSPFPDAYLHFDPDLGVSSVEDLALPQAPHSQENAEGPSPSGLRTFPPLFSPVHTGSSDPPSHIDSLASGKELSSHLSTLGLHPGLPSNYNHGFEISRPSMNEQTHPPVARSFNSHSFADSFTFYTSSFNHLKHAWNDPSDLRDLNHRISTQSASQTRYVGEDGENNLQNQAPDHFPPGEGFELPGIKRKHWKQEEMSERNFNKHVETALDRLAFPANSLSSALFARLFKPFHQFIHKEDWTVRSRESGPMANKFLRLSDESKLEPILQNAGIIDMIYDPQRMPMKKSSINTRMKNLVQWLVYINAAVMRQHGKGSPNDQSEEKSHQELLDWFFIQAVSSQLSYDLIQEFSQGRKRDVTKNGRDRPYWPKELDNSLDISFAAINIWYKRFKYEIWRDMGQTKKDVHRKMRFLVYQALYSDFKVDTEVEEEISHLGNFKLESFRKLPLSLRPRRRGSEFRCPADLGVKVIRENLQGKVYDFRGKTHLPGRTLIDPPIALVPTCREKKNWLIRLVNTPEIFPQPVPKSMLLRDVEFFLANIYLCHKTLLGYSMPDVTVEVKKSFQRQFFSWLHDVMFLENQEGSKFPVVGIIEATDISQINSSHFGPIQVYLMKYLNNQNSYKRVIHVALALLGYWYKNKNPDLFLLKFGNDGRYWKKMIECLGEDLTFQGVYSLPSLKENLEGGRSSKQNEKQKI